jgi:hypothetical protein
MRETRFYITSLLWIGSAWPILSPLDGRKRPSLGHDMNFRDDQCRVRTDHAPANFTTIKHMASTSSESPGKDPIRLRRKSPRDDGFLASSIAA